MAKKFTGTLIDILTDRVKKNPNNPRNIFYDEELTILKKSIREYGILVPITVYKEGRNYIIIDGERRWRCSRDIGLVTIPAEVVDAPTDDENILLMFQIHKTRVDWELTPTALSIEALLKLLPRDKRDKKSVANMTGLKPKRVEDCFKILEFDRKYIYMTLKHDKSRRIRGEFLSQLSEALEKLRPKDFRSLKLTKNQVIDIMIKKYENKEFSNMIEEFRTLKKALTVEDDFEKDSIMKEVKSYFVSKPTLDKKTQKVKKSSMSAIELYKKTTYNKDASEKVVKLSNELYDLLYNLDTNIIKDIKPIKKSLKNVVEIIDQVLLSIK